MKFIQITAHKEFERNSWYINPKLSNEEQPQRKLKNLHDNQCKQATAEWMQQQTPAPPTAGKCLTHSNRYDQYLTCYRQLFQQLYFVEIEIIFAQTDKLGSLRPKWFASI